MAGVQGPGTDRASSVALVRAAVEEKSRVACLTLLATRKGGGRGERDRARRTEPVEMQTGWTFYSGHRFLRDSAGKGGGR